MEKALNVPFLFNREKALDIQQAHKLAQHAINTQQYQQAQKALVFILNQEPNFYDAYFLLGTLEAELGQYTKAVALIEKAIAIHATAEYWAHLAKCFAMMGFTEKTHYAIAQAESLKINNALTLDTLGVALSRQGEHDKAIIYFERAIDNNETAAFYYNLASSQTFAGLFEKARASYEKAIELEPFFYRAHSSLSHLGGVTKENNHIERLQNVYEKMSHPDGKLHISHALARELEAVGDYEDCFKYLERAKTEKREKLNYSFAQDKVLFDALDRLFTDITFAKLQPELGYQEAEPIFVTGMPRSGTTLIERVLTNNTGVKSVGELQDFGLALKRLSATPGRYILDVNTVESSTNIDVKELGELYMTSVAPLIESGQRFVDKMPLNVLYAGLIIKALPKAKIVCVIRNPMDTVWGNYKQMFSLNDPYYNYAYDQTSIAHYYVHFVKLAQMWQRLFPENFTIVSYDEFVNNSSKVGKSVVEFCGLPYSDDLLDITKNKSAVATASSVQVRSAINAKSIGQWRRFESQLQPAVKVFESANLLFN